MERKRIKQAVILAGGQGVRLRPFTEDKPKAMYPINGKPFLGYLLEQVIGFGINQVILLLGYKSEVIREYIKEAWNDNELEIACRVTPVEYDTGARIKDAQELLDDDFLLMYCDNYCTICFHQLCNDYFSNHALVQLSAYENKDDYTKSNLRLDETGRVLCYDKNRQEKFLHGVDIGYALINKQALELYSDTNGNFEKIVYPQLVEQEILFATVTKHRYFSIGSWERILLTENFFKDPKTIFIDRDGTINVRPQKAQYIESPEQFVWLPGAIDALKIAKEAGYRIIMVTNQPGIARGNLTEDTLSQIHFKMQNDLKKNGCGIDAIYYCPHDWDDGCDCRKPEPGMFFRAEKDFSIDLTKCYMIGDDERDMEAAGKANCKCMMVDQTFGILDAVKKIIEEDKK